MDNNKPEDKSVPFSERKFDHQKNPTGSFLDTMFGRSKPPSKESAPLQKTKSKLETEGIRVIELQKGLEKIPDDFNIKMDKSKRGKVAGGIKREGGSQIIKMENLKKHIKSLKVKQSLAKTEQERLA